MVILISSLQFFFWHSMDKTTFLQTGLLIQDNLNDTFLLHMIYLNNQQYLTQYFDFGKYKCSDCQSHFLKFLVVPHEFWNTTFLKVQVKLHKQRNFSQQVLFWPKMLHQKESSDTKKLLLNKQKSNMLLLVLKTFGLEPGNNRHGPSSICIHDLHIPCKSSHHLLQVLLVAFLL